ncbi:MAG TPA: ATP-binding protein [Gemmatimonadaceae bacterium]|nr:ATP-binding protein [Gemmatimonadaceae bacterium]
MRSPRVAHIGTFGISALLGALAGLFVLHPITMAIYWFEFHPEFAGISTALHFVLFRMRVGFSAAMLPMTSVFVAIGGLLGVGFGVCIRLLVQRQRALDSLERELARNIDALLRAGESETIEFKASARWDLREDRISHAVQAATLKTIGGFLNHRGGSLLLGVRDDGEIVGLERDYSTLRHKNRDGFEQLLMGFVEDALGADFCTLVHVVFQTLAGKEVCRVVIEASRRPAYVRENDTTHFFVRTGNATRELDVEEALEHIARQTSSRRDA